MSKTWNVKTVMKNVSFVRSMPKSNGFFLGPRVILTPSVREVRSVACSQTKTKNKGKNNNSFTTESEDKSFLSVFITSRMTIQCFALICYRQAGKKVNRWTFKIFIPSPPTHPQKRESKYLKNLFSNTNSAVLKVWYEACWFGAQKSTFQTLCQAQEWQDEQLLFCWWT